MLAGSRGGRISADITIIIYVVWEVHVWGVCVWGALCFNAHPRSLYFDSLLVTYELSARIN